MAAPQEILAEQPYACIVLIGCSLLLSFWAVYLDPVVNTDGVGVLRAAGYIADGEWRAGLRVSDSPVYSVLVAWVSRLTGLSIGHGAHVLGAGFQALLTLGVVVVAVMLGGGRYAAVLGALVILLFPAFNALRPDVSPDVAFQALYMWGLGWFLHYAASGERRSLVLWTISFAAALLFSVQALVYLTVIPIWWLVRSGSNRLVKWTVIVLGVGIVLVYGLWRQALDPGMISTWMLRHPLAQLDAGWHEAGRVLGFKLEALNDGFLDHHSHNYDVVTMMATFVLMSAAGLVKTLGLLYAALAAYGFATIRRRPAEPAGEAWRLFLALGLVLLLVPACTALAVAQPDAMTVALTLLAVIPLSLDHLRHIGMERRTLLRWVFPAIVALVIAAGLRGLDLRTSDLQLREAGMWLRENAAPGDLYSNSRIVLYYSGMNGYRRPDEYTWRHAMNRVHREQWPRYDYVALAIDHDHRYREGILMRWVKVSPVKVFANDRGDRVLVFRVDG